jgi:hypothetical protein
MSDFQAVILACAAIVLFGAAAIVGISRAEAERACYEAAKVNVNITCDGASK